MRMLLDCDQASAGAQDAVHLLKRFSGPGHVVQNETGHGQVAARLFEREFAEVAAVKLDVGEFFLDNSLAGAFQHGGGGLDGDDAAKVGGELRKQVPGTAAEVGHNPIRGEQPDKRFQGEGFTEGGAAEIIPALAHPLEEGEIAVTSAADGAAKALLKGGGERLLAKPFENHAANVIGSMGIGDRLIENGGADPAVTNQRAVAKDFKMSRDGGLRLSEDGDKLADV